MRLSEKHISVSKKQKNFESQTRSRGHTAARQVKRRNENKQKYKPVAPYGGTMIAPYGGIASTEKQNKIKEKLQDESVAPYGGTTSRAKMKMEKQQDK